MEVQSIDINGGLQDIFSIGNTPSMCLDLVLRNTADTIFTTNQVKVEIGLKYDSTIEYIPLGIFNIADVKKDDFTTKFTCYDNMYKFDTAYFSKLGDTPTLLQVVNELASITGVEFIGSLPAYNVKKLEGFTCREILSYVASVCGGNALMTRDGKFNIIYPTDANRDIGEGVFDLKRDEVKYKIGKVTCQIKEKETISKGSLGTDSMELMFENPWVTDSILTDIYNRLNGFSYLGYNMKWQGDLALDVGDIITHTDVKGVTRKLPILNRKLSYDGGLDSELSAKGETKNSNFFSSSGSMKNKVDRMVTEVAVINEAFINYAKINDADITNLKVETAKIQNIEAETANMNTILAGNIGSGSVQTIHLTGQNVVIDNAVIKDLIAPNISVGDLKAGNIDSNRFNIVGSSGNLLIKDNTIQIKDANRTRVQIGKDASNDYNMYVWDSTGKLMFDATGLKADGIKSKIIRDDMISDTANINGSKINISSLITEVNKDTNTQVIKASKIAFDSTGQSLEVSFNSLKSSVDNIEVGGRNLLKSTTNQWTNLTMETGVWFYEYHSDVELVVGETYTFSITVDKTVVDNVAVNLHFGLGSSISNYIWDFPTWRKSNIPYNEKISLTYTVTASDVTSTRKYFAWRLRNEKIATAIRFKEVKLEKGNKATDWTPAPEDIEEKIQANTTAITIAQDSISGLITENTITKGDINTLKDKYTSVKATVDGINTTVSSHATSITNAQNTANNANTLADSKAKVFTSTPTTPYKIGDIWTGGPSGEIMKCKVARANGSYVATDWEKASKYTDDTKAKAVEQRVNTVEQNITATAITTTISSAINAGTSSITTTQFVMDTTGLTVKNGAIKIQNKAGATVLSADVNGNLSYTGKISNIQDGYGVEVDQGGVLLSIGSEIVGGIRSSKFTANTAINGISIVNTRDGEYIDLGFTDSETFGGVEFTPTIRISKVAHELTGNFKGVQFYDNVLVGKGRTVFFESTTDRYYHEIFGSAAGGLAIFGEDNISLGYKSAGSKYTILELNESADAQGNQAIFLKNLSMNSNKIFNANEIYRGSTTTGRYFHNGWCGSIEAEARRVSNLNVFYDSGWYGWYSGTSGAPEGYGLMLHLKLNADDFCQVAFGINNTFYTRWYANHAWTSWIKR